MIGERVIMYEILFVLNAIKIVTSFTRHSDNKVHFVCIFLQILPKLANSDNFRQSSDKVITNIKRMAFLLRHMRTVAN